MFNKIETAIINALRDNLKSVPKDNIGIKEPKPKNLPSITLTNENFEIIEVGIGRSIGGEGRETQETFSGDGKKTEFNLTEKPVKPFIGVEYPAGKRLDERNYKVDFEKNLITFQTPPAKGKDNVLVKYNKPLEVKTLKFNLRYHLDVWAENEAQRDEIAIEVIETLLRNEELLSQQGIGISPIKGFNIPTDDDNGKMYGKTLEYLVETDLQVPTAVPRIEKIEIKRE
jgi:hypothetical protein